MSAVALEIAHLNSVTKPASLPSVLREVRLAQKLSQADMGALLGLTFGMVSHIENGRRSLDQTGREVRHTLLALANQIPPANRSQELKTWMKTTTKEFKARPLGARMQLDGPGDLTIDVRAPHHQGDPDLTLVALERLLLAYDTHFHEKTDPEASDKFYAHVLTLLVRHANVDWDFSPEMTVFEALQSLLGSLRSNGHLQTPMADVQALDEEEDDEDLSFDF